MRKLFTFQIILTTIGLLISSYLQYLYSQPVEIGCTLTGCETVRKSPFSSFFGISMPIWGIVFFAALLIVVILSSTKLAKLRYLKLVMFLAAFVFALYLTYLEAFVIEAFCQWCLMVAFCTLILFVTGIFEIIQLKKNAWKLN